MQFLEQQMVIYYLTVCYLTNKQEVCRVHNSYNSCIYWHCSLVRKKINDAHVTDAYMEVEDKLEIIPHDCKILSRVS